MNNNTDRYLIITNADGLLWGSYDTDRTFCYGEAMVILQRVKMVDQNARLVKVIEEVE